MKPAAAAADWAVPSICTSGQLCELLEVPQNRLLWLADRRRSEYQQRKETLRNYRYFQLSKRSGGSRLIEAPKSVLKRIRRWIANQILRPIPVHHSVHGFVPDRSPVTSAQVHIRQQIVLRIDLRDFFPSITSKRVAGLFRTICYPDQAASLLTGLCTNRTWRGAVEPDTDPCQQLSESHLPQGSPASPHLANASAWSLDCRLSGLATKFGVRYTRYADDLIFSGGKELEFRLSRFRILALAIIHHEGFGIRASKTQAMRSDTRQFVTGMVVNERTNVKRAVFDRTKAILTNCLRYGLESQNRFHHPNFGAYVQGQIRWIQAVNPNRGAHLLSLWEKAMTAERLRNDSEVSTD
jgi:RNA-directed DNA polymerase